MVEDRHFEKCLASCSLNLLKISLSEVKIDLLPCFWVLCGFESECYRSQLFSLDQSGRVYEGVAEDISCIFTRFPVPTVQDVFKTWLHGVLKSSDDLSVQVFSTIIDNRVSPTSGLCDLCD